MSRGPDQRLQLRFPVGEEEGVTGLLDIRHLRRARVLVRDLSLRGAGLVVPDVDLVRGSTLLLRQSERPLGESTIEPVHIQDLDPKAHLVGVRFCNQSESFLQHLCRYLVQRHAQSGAPRILNDPLVEQRDPRRIRRLLVHCCRRRRSLALYSKAGVRLGAFGPEAVRQDRLVGVGPTNRLTLADGDACHLVLSSFTSVSVLPCRLAGSDGQRLAFSLPERMLQGGERCSGRLGLQDDYPIYLEFLHPQLPGRMVRKLSREASLSGLRFDLEVEDDLLVPGSVIESAILRLPGGESIACRGVVRHISRENGCYACGVELVEFPGNGRYRWVQALIARMNPNVKEAGPFDLREIWDVFERSGYLEEKPVERMLAMRRPFLKTWGKLLDHREGSRCWIYRERSSAVGTICTSRIYSNTWLVHHMAVDREVSAARKLLILAELFPRTAFQWLAGAEPDGHVLGYFDANRSFNQSIWINFFEQQPADAPQDVQRVHLRDVSLDRVVLPPRVPDLEVRDADEEELSGVSRLLLARDGPFVHEAFDLAPERITLASLATGPLRRSRRVLVARGEGRLLGYGFLESASPGVNIFALYDTCRIIVVDQTPRCGPTCIRDQLFAEMVRAHREAGGATLLYLEGRGDMPAPDTGDAFQAEAVRAVIAGSEIPRWVEFLNSVWARC